MNDSFHRWWNTLRTFQSACTFVPVALHDAVLSVKKWCACATWPWRKRLFYFIHNSITEYLPISGQFMNDWRPWSLHRIESLAVGMQKFWELSERNVKSKYCISSRLLSLQEPVWFTTRSILAYDASLALLFHGILYSKTKSENTFISTYLLQRRRQKYTYL
jgi:hypothetical protein